MRSRSGALVRAACAGGVVLAVAGAPRSGAEPIAPAEAMAFVRVIGDLRAEFTDAWRTPIEMEDVELATGSGFVVAPSGLILTSHHVVDDAPEVRRFGGHEAEVTIENRRIEVVLGAGGALGTFDAFLVASDAELDLAALQVTAAGLPRLPLGDSDAVEQGQAVRALGFPFGRQVEVGRPGREEVAPGVSVTAGSLSAARPDDSGATRYLQTDASVHPGSSGGPMVDEEGYVVGVVRMKLARGATGPGAGFGVPVNLVKDFLATHGLLGLLPEEQLRTGVVHTLDWKGIEIELPDGFEDTSPRRLLVDTGESEAGVSLRLVRLASPWDAPTLEEAVVQGHGGPGFAPGTLRGQGSKRNSNRVVGSARGEREDGRPFRVEYALLDLGAEKLVARYLGPPDDVAFNLSLLRRSLETFEAAPLLTDEVQSPLGGDLEPAPYPGGAGGSVLLPVGWSREPAAGASCGRVPPAETGLAARPAGDFTVVFRALRWSAPPGSPEEMARRCGAEAGPAYAGGFDRVGVEIGAWGTFVDQDGALLLLEAEAPEEKLPFVRDLYRVWVARVRR